MKKLICALLLIIAPFIYADAKQSKSTNNKSFHYVIIYQDNYGRQVTYNTHAKNKSDALHNLHSSRKVKKVINVKKN